jgi:hypothetical protein
MSEKETSHTPGPWKTQTHISLDRLEIRDADGRRIAVCAMDFPMSAKTHDANARLIASRRDGVARSAIRSAAKSRRRIRPVAMSISSSSATLVLQTDARTDYRAQQRDEDQQGRKGRKGGEGMKHVIVQTHASDMWVELEALKTRLDVFGFSAVKIKIRIIDTLLFMSAKAVVWDDSEAEQAGKGAE